ncbi:hypothetical protein GGI19_002348 [Coemansia pectinata]|uniref:P-loop containing nucleoside triphosphate hydrolase protein n=1 Tax=Coemansia pectinata TaxID=1052879 RepID=A0A9W8LCL4_9FUNG|nr:hypothetical protein GGI19_002348 [Coemansia pectinata]
MPSNKRSNRKAKAVRDPGAYATVSVRSARDPTATPATEVEAVAVAVDTPPILDETPVEAVVDAPPIPNNAAWVSLDLAQRQAASRLSLELSLKARMTASSPTIRLSPLSENTLVERMRSGYLPLPPAPVTSVVSERDWTRAANFVYETLIQYGFTSEDVERAMLAAKGSGDIIESLTWLCVHVPTDRMPVDMRDKHEFSGERKRPQQQPKKEEKEKEEPVAAVPSRARIDQVPETKDTELAVSLLDLGLDDDDEDGYSSDEDPNTCHARHMLQLRGYEEWTEYLQSNNTRNRYNPRIRALRDRIARLKRILGDLESDILFIESQSLAVCERMWPEYHDALLDDIRRFKDQEPEFVAEEIKPPVVDKPVVRKKDSPVDLSDSDDESVIGFGLSLEESWGTSSDTPASNIPRVVDTSAVPRGWTGAPPRDLLLAAVHRHDRHATVKYNATQCAYGYTCTLTVTWSQANKPLSPTRHIPNAIVETLGPVTQSWTVPPDLVGATARDARDLAVLVYLYTQEPSGERLAPPLADLWAAWDAQRKEEEDSENARRVSDRAAFLSMLREEYVSVSRVEPVTVDPETTVPQSAVRGSSTLRARMWGPQTINARRESSAWKQKFSAAQSRLPARQHRYQITAALSNQVCVIRGETGSGKSSQIPQYAVEHLFSHGYSGGRVLCTQPRRISAMTIASRVSQELGDTSVGTPGSLVGYQIRFNARTAESNALVFCTTGVLLRMAAGDPTLQGVSIIICDEVQERTLELDFLLILLRRLLPRRPDLKLILMSATIDTSAFACFFDACPVVDIPGRAYPVTSVYLPRLVQLSEYAMETNSRYATHAEPTGVGYAFYRHLGCDDPEYVSPVALTTIARMRTDVVNVDLIHHLLQGLNPATATISPWVEYCQTQVPTTGSVLVFLPGIAEIRRLLDLLHSDLTWATVVPLHSTFANESAAGGATYTELAFAPAVAGKRKIVLSTNVAETGITIPDVTVVIDCGMSNQAHWDRRRRLTTLSTLPVSKANVRQRAGRAGRLQPGIALCLFTEEQFRVMPEYEAPEMHRLPLASLCLQTKAHGVRDTMRFLMMSLDPPLQSAVAHAIVELQEAGALDDEEQLTPIGKHLCNLPVDLHVGKLLIAGALLGCLDHALTLAAALSTNSSILQSTGDAHLQYRRNPEQYLPHVTPALSSSSDFLVTLAAYEDWRRHATRASVTRSELRDFCRQSSLNRDALDSLEDCREQYLRLLYDQGLLRIDIPAGSTLTRVIRPSTHKALRQGLVVVPAGANKNNSLGVLYAALAMAFDHLIMSTPTGYAIGQTNVSKRVEGIGHAIQIADRERVSTRALEIDRRSILNHSSSGTLIAARLSSSGKSTFAHDLTRVSLSHVVLFSRTLDYWPKARQLSIDGWIDAKCYARSATVLMAMSRRLEEIIEFRVAYPLRELPDYLEKWQCAIVDVLKLECF